MQALMKIVNLWQRKQIYKVKKKLKQFVGPNLEYILECKFKLQEIIFVIVIAL